MPLARCASCFTELAEDGLCAKCSTRERSEIALALRQTLREGRYYVGRTLGEPGGFGMTYLGWDSALERKVALKEYFPWRTAMRVAGTSQAQPMSKSVATDYVQGLQGFLDEARRLAALDHENVVKVLDYLEANGTGYIMMPFYDGEDLGSYLDSRGGRLPWREVVDIMLPLLEGLQQVHDAGLIHRDIKPGNIYLAKGSRGEKRPILIDFGAARWATTTHELTAILTEGFAPLEQYPGCGAQGPTTDIYAVAATAYALIAGRVPATAPARTAGFAIEPLHEVVPEVPIGLTEAIDCALSLKPVDRPQRAVVFARMLRDAASGAAISGRASAPSASAPTMIVPPTRPSPLGIPSTRVDSGADRPAATVLESASQSHAAAPAAAPTARSRRPMIAIASATVVVAAVAAVVLMSQRSKGGAVTDPANIEHVPAVHLANTAGRLPPADASKSPVGARVVAPATGSPAGASGARALLDSAGRALKAGEYVVARRQSDRARAAGGVRAADSLAAVIIEACAAEQRLLGGRGDAASCPKRPW